MGGPFMTRPELRSGTERVGLTRGAGTRRDERRAWDCDTTGPGWTYKYLVIVDDR